MESEIRAILKSDVITVQELENGSYLVSSLIQSVILSDDKSIKRLNRGLENNKNNFVYVSDIPNTNPNSNHFPKLFMKTHMLNVVNIITRT